MAGNWWQESTKQKILGINTLFFLIIPRGYRKRLEDSCLCFFQNTIWWNVATVSDVAGSFEIYPMKFVKRMGIFAACLPICSEKDFRSDSTFIPTTRRWNKTLVSVAGMTWRHYQEQPQKQCRTPTEFKKWRTDWKGKYPKDPILIKWVRCGIRKWSTRQTC
jgi:hypothetical protein